jgi:hypothetical protein
MRGNMFWSSVDGTGLPSWIISGGNLRPGMSPSQAASISRDLVLP